MAAVGTIAAVAGTIGSLAMQSKAAKASEKAMKAQQKAQELADARARRRLLRETAMARGETVNLGANLGALNSSSLAGGLSGLTNQQQAQLGFQQTTLDVSKFITQQNIAQSRFNTMASLFSGVGDMFGSFAKSNRVASVNSPYSSVFNFNVGGTPT